jgi:phospholipase A2
LYVGLSYADDTITVFNHINVPVYVGMYYVKSNFLGVSSGPAERYGNIVEVPPHAQRRLVRPPWRFWVKNREIIFSMTSDVLKQNLTKEEYRLSSTKPAGQKYGNRYHIDTNDGIVTMHGALDFKILQPASTSIAEISNKIFNKINDYFMQQPYSHAQAFVRYGKDLSSDEQAYLVHRFEKTKLALEAVLSFQLPEYAVPRIALCLSGGGIRATVASYGLFLGLHEIGLFDAITYSVAGSGSTWLLSSYLVAGTDVPAYRSNLVKAVSHEYVPAPTAMVDTFLQKGAYKQPLSLIDLYGVYLSHKFFQSVSTDIGRQRVWFSDLRDRTDNGSFMLPLCAAVEITKSTRNPVWYTFSPYEIGSDELGLFVPTWAFGRRFLGGFSSKEQNAPELRLGYLMALWGSALSSTFKHMYEFAIQDRIESAAVRTVVKNILKQTIGPLQFAPVNVYNPFYGMEQTVYKDIEQLAFVDAGYVNNVPFVPLLQKNRAVNIVMVLDVSEHIHEDFGASVLQQSEQYALAHGYSFPSIDAAKIRHKAVQVFADANPETPIIIYIVPTKLTDHPGLGNPANEFSSVYKTTNFSYAEGDVERLIELVRFTVTENKDVITNAIRRKITQMMRP